MAYTHLDPGQELEISTRIHFSPEQTDISELVKLPPDQLKAQEADSVEQERAIFAKFSEVEKEWLKQAALTKVMAVIVEAVKRDEDRRMPRGFQIYFVFV